MSYLFTDISKKAFWMGYARMANITLDKTKRVWKLVVDPAVEETGFGSVGHLGIEEPVNWICQELPFGWNFKIVMLLEANKKHLQNTGGLSKTLEKASWRKCVNLDVSNIFISKVIHIKQFPPENTTNIFIYSYTQGLQKEKVSFKTKNTHCPFVQ